MSMLIMGLSADCESSLWLRPPESLLGSSHDADAFLKSRLITSSNFQDMFRDRVLVHCSRGCLGQPISQYHHHLY